MRFLQMLVYVLGMQAMDWNQANEIQHYSHYSEAYAVPGDVKTKGTDFLAEAERHLQNNRFEKGSVVRLASIQATLLLYER
jgi:hypothetical protein